MTVGGGHNGPVRISRGQLIVGVDAIRLRDALKRMKGTEFLADHLSELIGDMERASGVLAKELTAAGLIEVVPHRSKVRPNYRLTLAGSQLANAKAGRPVSRAVADRHLSGLIERAVQVNESDHFLVWVERLVVFGSYLDPTVSSLGDVDVAVELRPRFTGEEWGRRSEEHAMAAQRTFSTFVEFLSWPETEARLFLKSHSPVLSLTTTLDRILGMTRTRTVYERSARAD